ncbi:MAG: DUF3788 domain-containing protein [Coprobacillaceae bacterium]
MKWEVLFPKDAMPSFDDVKEYINNSLWDELHTILLEDYKVKTKVEYSGCSLPGWNIKYKKKGKSLCTVYPNQGYAKALVIANKINALEIESIISKCNEDIQKQYHDVDYLNGAKWLFFDIKSKEILNIVLELIAIRTQ